MVFLLLVSAVVSAGFFVQFHIDQGGLSLVKERGIGLDHV
jgi:hypothetical protein